MAARKAVRMQPAEIGAEMEESSERRQEPSPCVSKMVAVLLVLPGIVLYIYILYIVVSNLVFPGSLSPFLAQPVPSSPENATSGEAEVLQWKYQLCNGASIVKMKVTNTDPRTSGECQYTRATLSERG